MTNHPNDISTDKDNTKSLATLIIELNIARRNSGAYPKGHPVIAASLAKVLCVYKELLSNTEELVLGVTSDALMVDGVVFEKSNVVFRDFSRVLFERGIGALVFHRGLTIGELTNFTIILGLKREQIHQHGGIEQIWLKARITAMTIRPIRYDLFQTSDEDSASCLEPNEGLWDRFARELTVGGLSHGNSIDICLDPEIVAKVLNQQYATGTITEAEVRGAIASFFAAGDSESAPETNTDQSHQKLAAFISNLTPELRRQFLAGSFDDKNKDRQIISENILSNLSDSAILETLEDVNKDRLTVSPFILGLLQRLGQDVSPHQIASDDVSEEDALSSKIKVIFREQASEKYVPDDYQKKLDRIIVFDQIPAISMEEITAELNTLGNRSIENGIGQILMNLISEGVETPEERDLLLQNLGDMFEFFLQTGDYGQLHTMVDQLTDNTFPVEIQQRLRNEYGRRANLEEILDGLSIWGKPRYGDIRTLIHKIGGQFVEAILDRLSEENNMSLRRFYMDCLIEMGPLTRESIVRRLNDNRWYFLRNLLIILSARNDPSVVPQIRPLLRHNDPRLRHEVLKTLVHFRDPQAEKQIIDALESQNPELQTTAIQMAERCSSPAIATKLTIMVSQGGFSRIECEKKSAIVRALGEIGRGEAVPELVKILGSWSMLHPRLLAKLKTDIIRSLPKYPPEVSRPVLEQIAGGSGELGHQAKDTLRIISGMKS